MSVFPKGRIITCSCFLLRQPLLLPLRPHSIDSGVRVTFVERLTGNEHIAVVAAGVGTVTFFYNHNRVPHMAVHEVNLEFGESCCLAPTALDRVLN